MKIILSMAISANGIIASSTGSEDFLPHTNWIQFSKLVNKVGCFIWGRKTYEAVANWEGAYLSSVKNVKKIILSKTNIALMEGFELAHSPEEAVTLLQEQGFPEAVITGGATLNSEFAKRGLIDEVILDVNPIIIGRGIPVFRPTDFQLELDLAETEMLRDGIIELRYSVKKE